MGDDLGRRAVVPGREPPGTGLPAGSVILEQDFDFGSLYSLRAAVAAHAGAAGMTGTGLYDVVTAAHELAANAVRHGAGRGHLRLWVVGSVLYCEVSDAGPAPADQIGPAQDTAAGSSPAAGTVGNGDRPAPWREEHGHGLWVVSQIADQFTIDRAATVTTATAAFTLGTPD
ncbi:MAG TPA: ATP-binding protein [Trebonia sp.]|jgi:anti-sigma regulatory factor (Ser/Thr protein kinase)